MTNLDIVKGVYAAFDRGDIPAVLAALDPQIAWREAEGNPYEPGGKAWIGHDEIMQKLFMRIGAEWDYLRAIPHTFHDAGDTVIVWFEHRGVGNGAARTDGHTVGKGDPAVQARRCLEIIKEALERAGTSLDHVVRTRTLLTRIEDWQAVAAVHGEFFGQIRPANTIMQVSRFIDPDWLVEFEADAVVSD